MIDVVVIGSGPNGLSAAIALAKAGLQVHVIEGAETIGGGTRTEELTLPGFRHDVCSAVHPMGVLSPFWRTLPLQQHGLEWIHPRYSVAHPLDGGTAAVLCESMEETAERLGTDAGAWRGLMGPLLKGNAHRLVADILEPVGVPRRPLRMAHFGIRGLWPAGLFASTVFKTPQAKALFAGLAGHSILPFDAPLSAAVGLVFALTGHMTRWPIARGGSAAIPAALSAYFTSLGGTIETGRWVGSLDDVPECRAILFDTSPGPMADICGDALPSGYVRRLRRFEYGPGVFKLDFALDGPIPWEAAECHEASTVHVGGTLPEIAVSEKAAWRGVSPRHPYLIVCQQSLFDDSRAPSGKHTGYAYCHVPHGYAGDPTRAVEQQIERFAPGFHDLILAKRAWSPADLEAHNPNYVGGVIGGGATTWSQLFTRPVARLNPYTTPNPRIFIGSASTPPGGGVHGMNGYHAAQAILGRLGLPTRRIATRAEVRQLTTTVPAGAEA